VIISSGAEYHSVMPSPIHHITLTVRDIAVSAPWYEVLLGPAQVVSREGVGWRRIRLAWPSGLVIGLTEFVDSPRGAHFTPLNIGLDHLGIECSSEGEVREWAARLDSIGSRRGPVEDAPYGWAVTGRDPDGIPIEFYCPK
jgi:catechol 2,3-dioxygenase-like lactoylglutathione lyase family enzyme